MTKGKALPRQLEDGTWCVAWGPEHGAGMWLPGYFDAELTAVAAAHLPDDILADLNARICRIDGENRAITMGDIASASAAS